MTQELTAKELAVKLNGLMRKISDLGHEEKVVPYMGWFWRDVDDWEANALPLSLEGEQGMFWLDVARKWDYEFIRVNPEYSTRILEKMVKLAETFLELSNLLKDENVRKNEEKRKPKSQM